MQLMTLHDLLTPSVVIEKSRLLKNIERMQDAATRRGVRMRPHSKTHKSPLIARWQIEKGAVGICCAKLGEAEVMAHAGIDDIRLPYPLHPSNAERVFALQDMARISFIVDHMDVARGWSQAMQAAGRVADVLVKVDVGFHRCGIDPNASGAAEFVSTIAALPGLKLRGLLAHAGHGYHATSNQHLRQIADDEARTLRALADAVRQRGVTIEEISTGATPTARFSLDQDGITEFRAGNYAFFDRTQVGLGAASFDDCALTVLATVVSKPAADRLIFDSGSKTLTSDGARGFEAMRGHGAVFTDIAAVSRPDTDLLVERLSEEHATVRVETGRTRLEPGDRVRVVPNHSCVVTNLVDKIWLVDGNTVIQPLEVAARGKIA